MKTNKKAFITVLLIFIFSVCALPFMFSKKGSVAHVSIDGNTVISINLLTSVDKKIPLEKYGKNIILEVKNNSIRFLSSDCENKICINSGFVSKEGQTAVCLPNKTAITITGD